MAQVVKDLIRGGNDPVTLQGYATKGFKNEGVNGSTGVDRLTENGSKGITPDVMKMPSPPVKRIVKDSVKIKSIGPGVDLDYGAVKNRPSVGNKSAGYSGGSTQTHK